MEERWLAMQTELAATSLASAHLLAQDSGHHVHIEQPGVVAFAVAMLVERFRHAVAGTDASGLGGMDAGAAFTLHGAVWLTDNLNLYPRPTLAGMEPPECGPMSAPGCLRQ